MHKNVIFDTIDHDQHALSISTSLSQQENSLKTWSRLPIKIYFNGQLKFECQWVTSKSKKKNQTIKQKLKVF